MTSQRRRRFAFLSVLTAVLVTCSPTSIVNADDPVFKVKIEPSQFNRTNAIVRVPFKSTTKVPSSVKLRFPDGNTIAAQVAALSTRDRSHPGRDGNNLELQFVLPKLAAGQPLELTATIDDSEPTYIWHDDGSAESALHHNNVPMLTYMYQPLDDSSKERRAETYKTFHHVYRPDGIALMTKGAGGLFPHHRGIFFGYNRIAYGENKADVWHCKKGESQTHELSVERSGGTVFGRDLNVIQWRGQDGEPFATELRETTTRRIGDSVVIDFHSTIQSLVDTKIEFRGDPQHAGVQFRSSQDLPDHTKHLTFYIRPDGKAEPGEFRNWSSKKNESEVNLKHINLDWNAICLALPKDPKSAEGKLTEDQTDRFTVCYLDSPQNPKPARFSERDYGRFGSYFEYDLNPKASFSVNYRFYIAPGVLSVDAISELSKDFVKPLKALISK